MKRMIFCVTACLLLLSCGEVEKGEVSDESRFIWINQSDHTIQIIAREFQRLDPVEEGVLYDETLQKGEKFEYRQLGDGFGSMPRPEEIKFSSVTVRFDELPDVNYTRDAEAYLYGSFFPPDGYPEEHGLFLESSYEMVWVKTTPFLTTYTWTYTFTDADYEAARVWAEKQ